MDSSISLWLLSSCSSLVSSSSNLNGCVVLYSDGLSYDKLFIMLSSVLLSMANCVNSLSSEHSITDMSKSTMSNLFFRLIAMLGLLLWNPFLIKGGRLLSDDITCKSMKKSRYFLFSYFLIKFLNFLTPLAYF